MMKKLLLVPLLLLLPACSSSEQTYQLTEIGEDHRGIATYTFVSGNNEIVLYEDDMPRGGIVGREYSLELDESEDELIDQILSVNLVY